MARHHIRETDIALLTLIRQQPRYGYQLARLPEVKSLKLSTSQTYYILQKLESLGYTTMRVQGNDQAPNRLVHTITYRGKHFLEKGMVRKVLEAKEDLLNIRSQYYESIRRYERFAALRHQLASGNLFHTQS